MSTSMYFAVARVRDVLRCAKRDGVFMPPAIESSLAALVPLERILAAVDGITNDQWESLRVACYKYHRAMSSGAGAAGPCACGMLNGSSKACEALRTLQGMRVEAAP